MGEGLRQAGARLQGGFGAAARAVLLAPAASVRSGDTSLGAVSLFVVRAETYRIDYRIHSRAELLALAACFHSGAASLSAVRVIEKEPHRKRTR